MHKNPIIHIPCSCGSEMLVVEAETDPAWTSKGVMDFNISIFRHGHSDPLTWRDRLRFFWTLLVHGRLYYDQMILSKDQAFKLARFLLKQGK